MPCPCNAAVPKGPTFSFSNYWKRRWRRGGARRWRWCAAVAQRRGGARWQRWRDSGAVIEALNGPLPTAGATVAASGGDAGGAAMAAGASSGD